MGYFYSVLIMQLEITILENSVNIFWGKDHMWELWKGSTLGTWSFDCCYERSKKLGKPPRISHIKLLVHISSIWTGSNSHTVLQLFPTRCLPDALAQFQFQPQKIKGIWAGNSGKWNPNPSGGCRNEEICAFRSLLMGDND